MAIAPLIMIYGVVGQLQGGVSPGNELAGHLSRYQLQAEWGGFLLAVGVVLRLAGLSLA